MYIASLHFSNSMTAEIVVKSSHLFQIIPNGGYRNKNNINCGSINCVLV